MNLGKPLFAQLMDFLPWTTFARYVQRYGGELFFQWIKQHLRIKKFYDTSENAVKSQIWIAVSVYALVAIITKRLNLDASLYSLQQGLSSVELVTFLLERDGAEDIFYVGGALLGAG